MEKSKVKILLSVSIIALLFVFFSCGSSATTESPAKSVEENSKTEIDCSNCNEKSSEISIGDLIWAAKNLDVEKFANGDTIKKVSTIAEMQMVSEQGIPAWCFYQNDPENGVKYGKLYNSAAILDPRGIAPKGWHVATVLDWYKTLRYIEKSTLQLAKQMRDMLNQGITNGTKYAKIKESLDSAIKSKKRAAYKIKSCNGWSEMQGNGNNAYCFNALPAGMLFGSSYEKLGNNAMFWAIGPYNEEHDYTDYYVFNIGSNDNINNLLDDGIYGEYGDRTDNNWIYGGDDEACEHWQWIFPNATYDRRDHYDGWFVSVRLVKD